MKTKSKSKTTPTSTKKKSKSPVLKQALDQIEANIARIEAEERNGGPLPEAEAAPVTAKSKAKASKQQKAKAAKAPKPKPKKREGISGLNAAAKVLADSKEPLDANTIAERAIAAGWKTNGKTPHATIYAAIIREIAKKGTAGRFRKTDRGHFTVAPHAKRVK